MRLSLGVRELLCLCSAVVAGCAINPVSGRPEFVLVSTQGEKEMGQRQAKQVEQEMGFVDNAQLTSWVEAIGQRLAAHSPRHDVQYRFYLVDSPEPNAFALPGGYVYVTRGLLVLVNSEDELAGVMGHEIGHVAARHSVEQVTRTAPFAVLTNLSAAVTGLASPLLGQVVGGVGGLASGLILAPFSRDQEREADRVGQQMVAAAGWDPAALANILGTLERQQALEGNAAGGMSFLASHPSTPERVANTTAYAKELRRAPSDPICATRAAVLARLNGLVVGRDAAQGVIVGETFMHPELNFFVRFPDEWKVENARDAVGAIAPDQSAVVLLDVIGDGDDPLAGARALEKASGSPVVQYTKPTTVGDLKAAATRARTRTDSGEAVLALTWIAYGGHIYQILGIAPIRRADPFLHVYETAVQSFRPLQPSEHAAIRENRLRVVEARSDETVAALTTRSKSRWKPDMVAVVNEMSTDAPLAAGQLLKVAIAEPYTTVTR